MSITYTNTILTAITIVACIAVFFTSTGVFADSAQYTHPETGEQITKTEMLTYLREQISEAEERVAALTGTNIEDDSHSREEMIVFLNEEIAKASDRIKELSQRQADYAVDRERRIAFLREEIERVSKRIQQLSDEKTDRSAEAASLRKEIERVHAQIVTLSSGQDALSDLSVGAVGELVSALQSFLNMYGFTVASDGPGSEGKETTYFGLLTERALSAFQRAHDIPVTGVLDEQTRHLIDRIQIGVADALPSVSVKPSVVYVHPETGESITRRQMVRYLQLKIDEVRAAIHAKRIEHNSIGVLPVSNGTYVPGAPMPLNAGRILPFGDHGVPQFAPVLSAQQQQMHHEEMLAEIRREIQEVRQMLAVLLERKRLREVEQSAEVPVSDDIATDSSVVDEISPVVTDIAQEEPKELEELEEPEGPIEEEKGSNDTSSGILVTILVIILLVILFAVPAVMYWKNRDEVQ